MLIEKKVGKITWVDLTDPTKDEVEAMSARFELPVTIALSCLDPDHLPQLETAETTHLLVLRAFDLEPKSDVSSIQALTRKISIVQKPGLVVTVHRTPLPYVQSLFDSNVTERRLLPDLTARILKTYDAAITEIEDEFDDLEEAILDREKPLDSEKVQDLYTLKRRVTLLKRILRMTLEPIEEWPHSIDLNPARDLLDKHIFKLEEVYDNLIAIISLQISISAHRANEIMRVLTVYSILFLPLNLIAGIYGMNFEHIPYLRSEHGFSYALAAMALVAVGILFWLRRKGWLERPE